MRPNILLVVLDTARADGFEPWGARPGSTPAVAQMSSEGVARLGAYSTACWTVPAHASLLGGQLPRTLGISNTSAGNTPKDFRGAMRAQEDRLLPTVLGKAGWATAGFSANLWVSEASGFDTGFDEFHTVSAERISALGATDRRAVAQWYLEAARARLDDGATQIERSIGERLDGWRDDPRPFFMFVNLIECHSPYLPPAPWNDLSVLQRLLSGRDARRHESFTAFTRASLGAFDVPDADLERMRHLYARSIALLDDWLARLRETLDRHGVLDDTLVVVTSDHGENLGEGGLMGHCFSLDDRLIHVPLLASGPGADAFAGEGPWSLAQAPATIARAVELVEHPWNDALPGGVAVAQLDAPCAQDDPVAPEALAQLDLPPFTIDRLLQEYTLATDGRWKYRKDDHSGEESLLDLLDDPMELQWRPLDSARQAAAEAERPGALDLLRTGVDLARDGVGSAPAAAPPSGDDVDVDDLAARMELLGYL